MVRQAHHVREAFRGLFLFLIFTFGAASCGGGSGLGAGTGEDSGDGSLETGGPIDIPVPIAKMNGGVDETTLDFTRDVCPSGTSDCSTVAGTLTGSLTSATAVGSNILVFKDGACQETVNTKSDRSFTQAYQKAYLDEIVSYMAVPSSADCDDLSTLSAAIYFVIDSEGNIKFIMTNEVGVVRTNLAVYSEDSIILYQRADDGVTAVRSVERPRDGTSEVGEASLARVNEALRGEDLLAGILPEDLSGIGGTGEVCLMNPETGAVTCDGHVFFSDRERNLCYPENATWMAAAYKNSDSKMTIAIMNPDTLALIGGSEGILDVPAGEAKVERMTFYCTGEVLVVAKEFTDGTAALHRYQLAAFLTSLSKSDIAFDALYTSSEPISQPYVAIEAFLVFFVCGADGSQEICYSSTEGNSQPLLYEGILPAPSFVDFGSSATTTISHLTGVNTSLYSFMVCEADGGVYVIDKNQQANLLDAKGSYPITNGGASVIYLRSIGENPEVWKADIGYFGSSILISDETGLYITNPSVSCNGTSYPLASGPVTCSSFTKGTGPLAHDYVGIGFSASLDTTTLDGTNNIYFMKNGTKYPSEVTAFGTTFINVETGDTNPFSSSGTVTVVIDGDENSTEPIRSKTGEALIQDYEYTIIIP